MIGRIRLSRESVDFDGPDDAEARLLQTEREPATTGK